MEPRDISWLSGWLTPGWATVAVALGLLLVTATFLGTGPLAALRSATGREPPERPRRRPYREDEVEHYLTKRDERPRSALDDVVPLWRLYRQALKLDVLFALAYGVGLLVVLDGTLGLALRRAPAWWVLALFPLGAALVDLAENASLLTAVWVRAGRVQVLRRPARLAGWLTLAKWTLVLLTAVLIAIGIVALGTAGINGWTPPSLYLLLLTAVPVVVHPVVVKLGARISSYVPRRLARSAGIVLFAGSMLLLGSCGLSAHPCLAEARSSGLVHGIFWGLMLGALVACILGIGAAIPKVRARLGDEVTPDLRPWELWVTGPLILVGTALPEEIIFRGVLFSLWSEGHGLALAVVMSSISFGLWHVAPEIERVREKAKRGGARGGIAGGIAFTTAAGVGFALLRYWTGTIWLGVVLHAAVNLSALLASRMRSAAR